MLAYLINCHLSRCNTEPKALFFAFSQSYRVFMWKSLVCGRIVGAVEGIFFHFMSKVTCQTSRSVWCAAAGQCVSCAVFFSSFFSPLYFVGVKLWAPVVLLIPLSCDVSNSGCVIEISITVSRCQPIKTGQEQEHSRGEPSCQSDSKHTQKHTD